MVDIDLIPNSYRNKLWQRSWMQLCSVIFAAVIIAGVGGGVSLHRATSNMEFQLQALQKHKAVVMDQKAQIEGLTQQRTEHLRQLSLLRGLRSGVAARNLFTSIDNALASGDVWFVSWQFRRANLPLAEARTVNTGYFVVVPAGNAGNSNAWQTQTHMKIRGQAKDHAALSRFAQGLLAEKNIRDVHVERTSQRDYTNTSVVDFDLIVVLNDGVNSQ